MEFYKTALSAYFVLMIYYPVYLGFVIGDVFYRNSRNRDKRLGEDVIFVALIVLAYLFILYNYGLMEGKRDSNPLYSKLMIIENKEGEKMRLLNENSGVVYMAKLEGEGKTKILIRSFENVGYIYKKTNEN